METVSLKSKYKTKFTMKTILRIYMLCFYHLLLCPWFLYQVSTTGSVRWIISSFAGFWQQTWSSTVWNYCFYSCMTFLWLTCEDVNLGHLLRWQHCCFCYDSLITSLLFLSAAEALARLFYPFFPNTPHILFISSSLLYPPHSLAAQHPQLLL